jgi:hypothetical protein
MLLRMTTLLCVAGLLSPPISLDTGSEGPTVQACGAETDFNQEG